MARRHLFLSPTDAWIVAHRPVCAVANLDCRPKQLFTLARASASQQWASYVRLFGHPTQPEGCSNKYCTMRLIEIPPVLAAPYWPARMLIVLKCASWLLVVFALRMHYRYLARRLELLINVSGLGWCVARAPHCNGPEWFVNKNSEPCLHKLDWLPPD